MIWFINILFYFIFCYILLYYIYIFYIYNNNNNNYQLSNINTNKDSPTTPTISNISFDTKSFLLNNTTNINTNSKGNNGTIVNRNISNNSSKDSKMNINAKAFEPSKKANSNHSTHGSTPQPKSFDNYSDNSTTSTLFSNSSTFPTQNNSNGGSSSEVHSSTTSMTTLNESSGGGSGGGSGGPFDYSNPNLLNLEVYHSYLRNTTNPTNNTSSTGHGHGHGHGNNGPLENLTYGFCASPTGSISNNYGPFPDYLHINTTSSSGGNGSSNSIERINEHRTELTQSKLTEDAFGMDGMLNLDLHPTSTPSVASSHDMFGFGSVHPLLSSSNTSKGQVNAMAAAAVAAMYGNSTTATTTTNPPSTIIHPSLSLSNSTGDPRLSSNEAISSLYPSIPTLLNTKLGTTFGPSSIPTTPNAMMNNPSSLLPPTTAIPPSMINMTDPFTTTTTTHPGFTGGNTQHSVKTANMTTTTTAAMATTTTTNTNTNTNANTGLTTNPLLDHSWIRGGSSSADKISSLSHLAHRPTSQEGLSVSSEVMLNAMKNSNSLDDFAYPMLQANKGQGQSNSVNHPIIYHHLNKNHSLGVLNEAGMVNTPTMEPSILESSSELISSPLLYSCYRSTSTTEHPTSNRSTTNTNTNLNVNQILEPSPMAHPGMQNSNSIPLVMDKDDYLYFMNNDMDPEKAKLFNAFLNPKFTQMNDYFKSIQKPNSREVLNSSAITTTTTTTTATHTHPLNLNPSGYGINTISSTMMNGPILHQQQQQQLQQQQQSPFPETNNPCSQSNYNYIDKLIIFILYLFSYIRE